MDFKKQIHLKAFKQLIQKIDVFIDPYRPGVLEKLGLSPKTLMELNKSLIICRITGYGQIGPYKNKPGHDLNYLADSGVLSSFGPLNAPPIFPNNLLVS